MKEGMMTAEELEERFDGDNELYLSVEKYFRSKGIPAANFSSDTCGLCKKFLKPNSCGKECPLLAMGECCFNGNGLYQEMMEGDGRKFNKHHEELTRYLLQALLYQDPEAAMDFLEEDINDEI